MTRELLTGADFKGPLQINGSAGTSGQLLASQGNGAIPQWVAAGGFSGGTLTSNLTLAAGTTSLSPLTLQSGTNLTTATAGAVEYDGKVVYSTPAGRGVSPSMMFYRLNSGLVGANVGTDQKIFGVGLTLQSSTVYAFEQFFALQKSGSAITHSCRISFGGTATINNLLYMGNAVGATSSGPPLLFFSAGMIISNSVSTFEITGSSSAAVRLIYVMMSGTVSIASGGTFIPQYSLSSAPGSPYTTLAGSYCTIWPIGAAGANTSVGPWA